MDSRAASATGCGSVLGSTGLSSKSSGAQANRRSEMLQQLPPRRCAGATVAPAQARANLANWPPSWESRQPRGASRNGSDFLPLGAQPHMPSERAPARNEVQFDAGRGSPERRPGSSESSLALPFVTPMHWRGTSQSAAPTLQARSARIFLGPDALSSGGPARLFAPIEPGGTGATRAQPTPARGAPLPDIGGNTGGCCCLRPLAPGPLRRA